VVERLAIFCVPRSEEPPRFRLQDGQLRQQARRIVPGSGIESMHAFTHDGQFK